MTGADFAAASGKEDAEQFANDPAGNARKATRSDRATIFQDGCRTGLRRSATRDRVRALPRLTGRKAAVTVLLIRDGSRLEMAVGQADSIPDAGGLRAATLPPRLLRLQSWRVGLGRASWPRLVRDRAKSHNGFEQVGLLRKSRLQRRTHSTSCNITGWIGVTSQSDTARRLACARLPCLSWDRPNQVDRARRDARPHPAAARRRRLPAVRDHQCCPAVEPHAHELAVVPAAVHVALLARHLVPARSC